MHINQYDKPTARRCMRVSSSEGGALHAKVETRLRTILAVRDAQVLVEAVRRWQELLALSKVPLTYRHALVTNLGQRSCERGLILWEPTCCIRDKDSWDHPGTNGKPARHHGGSRWRAEMRR